MAHSTHPGVAVGPLPAGFRFQARIYDLLHLRAYDTTYERPAEEGKPPVRFRVAVSFSHHCFTKGIDTKAGFPDEQVFTHANEARLFDVRRWNLSRQLPEIVDGLATRECQHANNSNFVTIAIVDEDGNSADYEVYFRVKKTGKGRLWLNIESAYIREEQRLADRPKGKRIRFLVILHNVLNGKSLRS